MSSKTSSFLTFISVLVLSSVTFANTDQSLPKDPKFSGQNTYINHWLQAGDSYRLMQTFKNNETLREDVEHVIADLAKIRSLGDIAKLHGSEIEKVLKQDVGKMVGDLFKGLASRSRSGPIPPSQCINDTGRMFIELTNGTKWAIDMLDSIGKPGPSITQGRLTWLGNYDQCRSAVAPPDASKFSKGFKAQFMAVPFYLPGGLVAYWSVCFPDTCKPYEVYLLLNDTKTALNVKAVTVGFPTIMNDEREYTGATYAAIIFICLIGICMIVGTAYDVILIQMPKWAKSEESNASVNGEALQGGYKKFEENGTPVSAVSNGYHTGHDENGYHPGMNENGYHASQNGTVVEEPVKRMYSLTSRQNLESSVLTKIMVAFSVYTNTTKFLNTNIPPGTLGAIHGIRFLSMSWVLLGHVFFFIQTYILNKTTVISLLQDRFTFDAICNALVSVDSFFTLSGLLTAYLTVKEMKKKSWLKLNWGLFYFHRFWRLTPPYMLSLLVVLGLSRFMGSGNMWSPVQPGDKENCEDYWWTNLLYINNLYKPEKMCFGHSWYLANDMQFFIISPLMMIPFYFSEIAGVVVCGCFLLFNWIITGVMSSTKNWPSTFFSPEATLHPESLESWSNDYYFKPWTRLGPYVVGILVGALLATKRIRLNRLSNAIGWIAATATALAVVYGLRGDTNGHHPLSNDVHAFYNAVARSAWGACVCWVIVSCAQGYGGFVNSILTFRPFVSLGRLTYMAYLIHPAILGSYIQNRNQLFYMNDFNVIIVYLGILVLVNMSAFVFMLGFESPMIGLEKALLPKRRD